MPESSVKRILCLAAAWSFAVASLSAQGGMPGPPVHPRAEAGCIEAASRFAEPLVLNTTNGVTVVQMPGSPSVVRNGQNLRVRGFYKGRLFPTSSPDVHVFPANHLGGPNEVKAADITGCTPSAFAEFLTTLIHEMFHDPAACGEHNSPPGPNGIDCTGISIDIGTARSICDFISNYICECRADPNCPPLKDPQGNPTSINTNEDLDKLQAAMCSKYEQVRQRVNGRAQEAAECACAGWLPDNTPPPPFVGACPLLPMPSNCMPPTPDPGELVGPCNSCPDCPPQ